MEQQTLNFRAEAPRSPRRDRRAEGERLLA